MSPPWNLSPLPSAPPPLSHYTTASALKSSPSPLTSPSPLLSTTSPVKQSTAAEGGIKFWREHYEQCKRWKNAACRHARESAAAEKRAKVLAAKRLKERDEAPPLSANGMSGCSRSRMATQSDLTDERHGAVRTRPCVAQGGDGPRWQSRAALLAAVAN